MSEYGLPLAFAAFVWWFTTGLILLLDGLPRRTFRWSLATWTAIAALALWALRSASAHADVASAFCAFACAILVWGWQEIAFLTGAVTGPRRTAAPPGARGWRHFIHALQTILYHEIAILISAALVIAVSWGGPNQVGTWTFVILWVMRTSAKLNLFLGVRNTSEELLPEHLTYLRSYFTRKPMNLLFPFSVTAGTVVAALLAWFALGEATSPFGVAGALLLAAILGLAVVEHWFLMLPIPSNALWDWALRTRRARDERQRGPLRKEPPPIAPHQTRITPT